MNAPHDMSDMNQSMGGRNLQEFVYGDSKMTSSYMLSKMWIMEKNIIA
jgi:hypothetical protein